MRCKLAALALSCLVAGAAVAPLPALARAVLYDCTVREHGNSDYVSPVYLIVRDPDTDQVAVSDPLILYVNDEQPIAGRVILDNAARTTFGWTLRRLSNAGNQFLHQLDYRATVIKATGKIEIRATPVGYANYFSGSGTCVVQQVKGSVANMLK